LVLWVSLAARFLLAAVWLYAGASKVTNLPASVRAVHAYQLVPNGVGDVIGAALPFVEITLGLLLVVGLGQRATAVASGALLTIFIVAIAAAWARGLRIDCGCFGSGGALAAGQSPRYLGELARDLGLLAAAAVLATWPYTRFSIDRRLDEQP
jgi:uncharacterized membrane protein YphA (DoxX/SURF4 family)